eukprot:2673314-Prymnesium_polylepis.1
MAAARVPSPSAAAGGRRGGHGHGGERGRGRRGGGDARATRGAPTMAMRTRVMIAKALVASRAALRGRRDFARALRAD